MVGGRATVLGIGQGCATLIEIWDTATPNVNQFVGLMDCGSDDNKEKVNVKESIRLIKEAMEKHVTYQHMSPPYLDLLVISHQDKDHWDKLDMLFTSVKGKRTLATVNAPVEMCIPDVIRISPAIFNPLVIQNSAEEYYSKLKTESDNTLYNAYQNIVINGLAYSNELELFYEINKAGNYIPKQIINITLNDLDFSVTLNYQENDSFGEWEINQDEYSWTCSFSIYKPNEYWLKIDDDFISSTNTFNLEDEFKNSLLYIGGMLDSNVDVDTIWHIVKTYINYLAAIKHLDIIATVDNCYQITQCIGQVYIGGQSDLDSASFKRMRTRLKALSVTGVFDLTDKYDQLNIYGWDLPFWVMCCKNYKDLGYGGSAAIGIKRNATGAVVLWDGANKILFSGDATVHTMFYMRTNDLLKHTTGSVLIAPHHGSGTTSKDCSKPDKWTELDSFLAGIKPNSIVISSGYENHHGHPNMSFIDSSKKALNVDVDEHHLYYNTVASGKTNKNYQNDGVTKRKLFTTIINKQIPASTVMGYSNVEFDIYTPNTMKVNYINDLENIVIPMVVKASLCNILQNHTIAIEDIDFLDYKAGRD
ncbi:MAG: hypothetical protein P4L69_02755 [Desulfosporosinus sp.]|nr:hypothetical protein [Desulfosporosinus sp.]